MAWYWIVLIVLAALFGLLFLVGFGILAYPTVSNQWNTYRQSRLIRIMNRRSAICSRRITRKSGKRRESSTVLWYRIIYMVMCSAVMMWT